MSILFVLFVILFFISAVFCSQHQEVGSEQLAHWYESFISPAAESFLQKLHSRELQSMPKECKDMLANAAVVDRVWDKYKLEELEKWIAHVFETSQFSKGSCGHKIKQKILKKQQKMAPRIPKLKFGKESMPRPEPTGDDLLDKDYSKHLSKAAERVIKRMHSEDIPHMPDECKRNLTATAKILGKLKEADQASKEDWIKSYFRDGDWAEGTCNFRVREALLRHEESEERVKPKTSWQSWLQKNVKPLKTTPLQSELISTDGIYKAYCEIQQPSLLNVSLCPDNDPKLVSFFQDVVRSFYTDATLLEHVLSRKRVKHLLKFRADYASSQVGDLDPFQSEWFRNVFCKIVDASEDPFSVKVFFLHQAFSLLPRPAFLKSAEQANAIKSIFGISDGMDEEPWTVDDLLRSYEDDLKDAGGQFISSLRLDTEYVMPEPCRVAIAIDAFDHNYKSALDNVKVSKIKDFFLYGHFPRGSCGHQLQKKLKMVAKERRKALGLKKPKEQGKLQKLLAWQTSPDYLHNRV